MTADTAPDGIMFLKHNSTAADDLVTEEMVLRFAAIISSRVEHGCGWVDAATEALRAVAPLIAARQKERDAKKRDDVSTEPNVGDALEAERTHLLRLLVEALMTMPPTISLGHKAAYFPDERGVGLPQRIAAAIRARGETT
jgi:hypothetical protein